MLPVSVSVCRDSRALQGACARVLRAEGACAPRALAAEGYDGKSVTVASVDIGAGTTDVMVCTYMCTGNDEGTLTPRPVFWDSFYVAGDDILRNIIQNVVIAGPGTRLSRYGQYILRACQPPDALRCRCHCRDTVDGAPRVLPHACGRFAVGAFRGCRQSRQGAYGCIVASRLLWRRQHYDGGSRQALPGGLQHAGVAPDGSKFFMEQLRLHRPSRVFTFDEIFPDIKPSAYLLDYFLPSISVSASRSLNGDSTPSVWPTSLNPLWRSCSSRFL